MDMEALATVWSGPEYGLTLRSCESEIRRKMNMEERKVRIADIAEELGLSTATVSYVLNGRKGKVSERTARKVRQVLEERGYLPRAAEILLGQNPERIVGVLVNRHEKYEDHILEDAFLSSALNALSAETGRRGLQMMVRTVVSEEEIVSFASMWNLEGLVLIGFCSMDYGNLRGRVRVPFAVYDGCGVTAERVFCVNIDDRQGGFQVGEYFRVCGHRRALCLADNRVDMDLARWEGFREGFGAGAEFLLIPMRKEERIAFWRENLAFLLRYSAIFAVSDFYAVELMHVLMESGVRVPEDVSIAGFDDSPLCGMVWPSLTSVRQDTAMRASAALDALRQLRAGGEVEPAITLPVSLVVRGSTAFVQSAQK